MSASKRDWYSLYEEFKTLDMSANSFAKMKGIPGSTLGSRFRKIRKETDSDSSFIPVKVVPYVKNKQEHFPQLPNRKSLKECPIEISSGAFSVKVSEMQDIKLLKQVLKVIKELC